MGKSGVGPGCAGRLRLRGSRPSGRGPRSRRGLAREAASGGEPAEQRRAFILIDAILGLLVVGVLTTVVVATNRWGRRAADGLADVRAATAAAEAALVTGRPAAGVTVVPTAGGAAVPGHHWARATAVVGRRSVSLVGLVGDGGGR